MHLERPRNRVPWVFLHSIDVFPPPATISAGVHVRQRQVHL